MQRQRDDKDEAPELHRDDPDGRPQHTRSDFCPKVRGLTQDRLAPEILLQLVNILSSLFMTLVFQQINKVPVDEHL